MPRAVTSTIPIAVGFELAPECIHPPETDVDEEIGGRSKAVDEAARQLLVAPAPNADRVWGKWEVLEDYVNADAIEGEHESPHRRRSGAREG